MDELNLKELFRYIVSKFYVVLIVLAIVLAGGEFYALAIKTPMYNSTTKLVLTEQKTNTVITTNDVTLSNNLVKTYSEIVKSRDVLSKVIDELKLGMSVDQLAEKINVSSVTNTQLINVTVSDKDAEMAQKIANSVAKVFKAEIVTLYKIDNVQIVDKATAATVPYNVNYTKQTIEYALAGLAAGIGIVLLMFYLDNTIKNSQTVENKTGLVVLGVVPNAGKK